jgi:tetratricopeptide (TPR) repeat protein
MSSNVDPSVRLDSWKDIAAYLKRDVSTVQRWEKREGMPVHRHVHGKLGSVYAFRSELDAWWRGRGGGLTHPGGQGPGASAPAALEPSESESPRANRSDERRVIPGRLWSTHRPLVIAGIIALAFVGTVVVALTIGRGPAGLGVTPSLSKPVAVNTEAQELLLRAKYLSVRTTDADNQNAIAHIERAIALDPSFAPAHAALASAYVIRLAYVTPDETRELEEKAFAAAERALSLDPNVPEAYLARGDLLWTHSQRFAHDRAVQEFRRALGLNPESDEIHRRLARVYVHVGFFDEALQHAERALAVNPSNAQALNSRAQALLWMGRDEEALSILSSIPGPVLPELVEANTVFALERLRRHEEAWTCLRQAKGKYPNDPTGNLLGIEALLLAESDPRSARTVLEAVGQRKAANPSHHAAYFAACALARMRQAGEAVRWLREAAATGFPCYPLFASDPNLDPIRQDPRFQTFMAEMQQRSASLRNNLLSVGN